MTGRQLEAMNVGLRRVASESVARIGEHTPAPTEKVKKKEGKRKKKEKGKTAHARCYK